MYPFTPRRAEHTGQVEQAAGEEIEEENELTLPFIPCGEGKKPWIILLLEKNRRNELRWDVGSEEIGGPFRVES